MRAIILAAGEGIRMRPLTASMPKVMLPVGNRPILAYVVEALAKNDIRDITMVVGYHREKVQQYFGSGKEFGVHIRYVFQDKQLGTAHALYCAKTTGDFLLLFGDNIVDAENIAVLKNTEKNTILAAYRPKPNRYGALKVRGNRVLDLSEKPELGDKTLVFTGMGHFGEELFEAIESVFESEEYRLTPALNKLDLKYVLLKSGWQDATYPLELLNINSMALERITRTVAGKIESSATIIGNVEIGEHSIIESGAYIRGNVKIGNNCVIGANSVILGDTSIGNGVRIGPMTHIKNSIVMESTALGAGSIVEDSVIGRDVVIGPRLTVISGIAHKIVNAHVVEQEGGVVIGDSANIGAVVIIRAGVSIGANANVADLKVISEDIRDGESVR